MSIIDWVVLITTLSFIVLYGVWKTRGTKSIESFLLADKSMKWWVVCLSIMATQASAITFLSTPGQAFQDGMRFIQFYLGLPIAMVIISITAVPIYNRLKVYTAYEYLESRFDYKTRSLAALLFLIQRGLSTGITIYAPAIVLSVIMGWSVNITIVIIGVLVIIYTVTGGTKAVSITHTQQMAVIFAGMFMAGYMVVSLLPKEITFSDAVLIAGRMGKMNVLNFDFDWNDRYNFWSGIIGGTFLALSYFGTDQSQVARYLSGESVTESRMGLLFNGLLKIPMQFMILFLGVMVFVFYQFYQPPIFFNKVERENAYSAFPKEMERLEKEQAEVFQEKKESIQLLQKAIHEGHTEEIKQLETIILKAEKQRVDLNEEVKGVILKSNPAADTQDSDFVFITFVLDYLPPGLVGLLMAVIFSAAMSSTAAGLNALASTTFIDVYQRSIKKTPSSGEHKVAVSRVLTIMWGGLAIIFAILASFLDNLIQAVNILGSLFYGTILGIFLAAFYFKKIKSNAVFVGAIIAEIAVIWCFFNLSISYLWYNVIGCILVIAIGFMVELLFPKR